MQFTTRQLLTWPRPITKSRRRGPYSVGYNKTLDELEAELQALGAKGDVVIQIDVEEGGIRRDGMPYADARVRTPRVAVAFHSKHGPLTYYCDRFFDWHDNVRAIGLGLQRLRLVEETGIVTRGEQYAGFKQLPSVIELGPGTMSVDEAARVISSSATPGVTTIELVLSGSATFKDLYRVAAKRCNPDGGGDRVAWDKLQAAAAVLEKHFAGG